MQTGFMIGSVITGGPATQIQLVFSDPIDPNSMRIDANQRSVLVALTHNIVIAVIPPVPTTIKVNGNTLIINTDVPLPAGLYQLAVIASADGIKFTTGATLDSIDANLRLMISFQVV